MAVPGFKVGDKVAHPAFGEGLVLAITGAGEALAYRVSFGPDSVQKLLLARIAPLSLVKSAEAAPRKSRGAA